MRMKIPFSQNSTARWIWSSEKTHMRADKCSSSHYEVRRFRRVFELSDSDGSSLQVSVSADSRFVLFCNDVVVARGPAKGNVAHHFYSAVDLSGHLRRGKNVLEALVMDFSKVQCYPPELGAPCWSINHSGGFLLEGMVEGKQRMDISTNSDWEVQVDQSFEFHNEGCPHGGFIGYFERVYPLRRDDEWVPATELYPPVRIEDYRDAPSPYGLAEAIVPRLAESEPCRFDSAFIPGGGDVSPEVKKWLDGEELVIQSESDFEVILDAGSLKTGFPVLKTSGGENAVVRMMYAEGLRLPWSVSDANILGRGIDTSKVSVMNTNEQAGWTLDRRGTIAGWFDEVHVPGGEYSYEPFHWRTFQFIKVSIRTAGERLTVGPLTFRNAGFPFEKMYSFECSDSFFNTLDRISRQTFALCTHETFEDCPYYEQMQYSGDSQITSLIAMAGTGDSRLTKQALYHFYWSMLPEGITQCRYPSTLPVIIPSWSLHYIFMLADYCDYTGDIRTVREIMPCVRNILAWFARYKDESGLPARLPHWNIVDWSPRWDRGCPPGWDKGPTCIISSQYLHALKKAAVLERLAGDLVSGDDFDWQADMVAGRINELFWNDKRGLYEDLPGGPDASQYGNAWAVYSGAAPADRAVRAMREVMENDKLDPASFFGIYFVVRALRVCGMYERFTELLKRWQEMIDGGFSTWAEDITYWRSLCHAWSAWPTVEFLTEVLGVKPGKPGFEEVLIQPNPVHLKYARGTVPAPGGDVTVAWERLDEEFRMEVKGPAGTPLRIIMPDGKQHKITDGVFSGGCAC